ncbi:hypothetical protein KAX02_08225 [candidate division WOR-3 bacterium]|nr:hypothetical protein [candidate division WOR-3 bacterium]
MSAYNEEQKAAIVNAYWKDEKPECPICHSRRFNIKLETSSTGRWDLKFVCKRCNDGFSWDSDMDASWREKHQKEGFLTVGDIEED